VNNLPCVEQVKEELSLKEMKYIQNDRPSVHPPVGIIKIEQRIEGVLSICPSILAIHRFMKCGDMRKR
jgi:hypothetical protein